MFSFVFAAFIFSFKSASFGHSNGLIFPEEGDACNRNDETWYSVPNRSDSFLLCHKKHGIFVTRLCGSTPEGNQRVFNPSTQQCVPSNTSAVSGKHTINNHCMSDEDCQTHEYCNEQRMCHCQNGYTNISNECFPSFEMNDDRCQSNEQCSTWYGSHCVQGNCICPKGTMILTVSGDMFCSGPDRCPLGGSMVALTENQGCGKNCSHMDKTKLPQLYDCIYAEGFTKSLCCPNRMYTCMQPSVAGNGPLHLQRYYYNPMTDQCEIFEFRGGSLINSNVFDTISQCENYCKTSCKRGNPQMRASSVVHCNQDSECGSSYSCFIRSNDGSGLCCPVTEFICSALGGLHVEGKFADDPFIEYDSGLHPENPSSIYFPVVRYYFSMSEMRCKAFLYHGMGGNFNNFLTLEHCQSFCGSVMCGGTDPATNEKNQWIVCNSDEQCPLLHQCVNKVCCKQKFGSYCPANSEPAIENGTSRWCNVTKACPHDSVCKLLEHSQTMGICCRTVFSHQHQMPKCPGDSVLTLEVLTNDVITCSLGSQGKCPSGSICSFESINATSGICCSAPVENIPCPFGMTAIVDDKTLHQCSPLHLSSCPKDGICIFNEILGLYYCCANIVPRCPAGYKPLIEQSTSMPFVCLVNQLVDICPGSSKCISEHGLSNQSVCCELDLECPINSYLLFNDESTSPATCTETCPDGHFCHTTKFGAKVCCSEDPLIGMCDHGKALKDPQDTPYLCSSVKRCPIGYNCLSRDRISICCPQAEHVCALPVDTGVNCQTEHESMQFYFDTESKQCIQYLYKGCGGNDNRFESFDQCSAFCRLAAICEVGYPLLETGNVPLTCSGTNKCPLNYDCIETANGVRYCCPSSALVCFQPRPNIETCPKTQQPMEIWFFDPSRLSCESSTQSRLCPENLNQFSTKEQCQSFCFRTLCIIGSAFISNDHVKQCLVDSDCSIGYMCQPLKKELPSICCPRSELICNQPQSRGVQCGELQFRYSYRYHSGMCEKFTYMGCKGNMNNFVSRETCEAACQNEANYCSDGAEPYYDTNTNIVVRCSQADSCAVGYSCHMARPNVSFCCKAPIKCASGKHPYIRQNESAPRQCMPGHFGIFDGCPPDYSCELLQSGGFYCCLEAGLSEACAMDSQPHVHSGSNKATKCFSFDSTCPFGFSCNFNEAYRQYFCCRNKMSLFKPAVIASGFACHDGTAPFVDPHLKTVRICSPYLRFSCPSDYECIYNGKASTYQCCMTRSESSQRIDWDYQLACPSGLFPYLEGSTGRPVVCQPSMPGICPHLSLCQYSPLFWQFICCTTGNMATKDSVTKPVFLPGEVGCINDEQCSNGYIGSKCLDSLCSCPDHMITYMHSCVHDCPPGYWKNLGQCQLIMPTDRQVTKS